MKKKIMVAVLLVGFFAPFFKVNYYVEGEGIVTEKKSAVQVFVRDLQDGTLGTSF